MPLTRAPIRTPPQPSGAVLPALTVPDAAAEAHHRIANSLQLVSALIAGELRGLDDPRGQEALRRTQARISAISGVHRLLQGMQDGSQPDLGLLIESICRAFGKSLPEYRQLHVSAEPLRVSTRSASLIAVATLELVMNAAKHAYDMDEPGDIHVRLRTTGPSDLWLVVEDRGTGLKGAGNSGLGSALIEATLRQLDGQLHWENAKPGLRVVLRMCLEGQG